MVKKLSDYIQYSICELAIFTSYKRWSPTDWKRVFVFLGCRQACIIKIASLMHSSLEEYDYIMQRIL